MTARSRRRQRLANASFGPEWRPWGQMVAWLIGQKSTTRERDKMRALLRDARRDLAAAERRLDRAGR